MKKLIYQLMVVTLLLLLFQCERAENQPEPSRIDYSQFVQKKEFTYAPELEMYQVPIDEVSNEQRISCALRNEDFVPERGIF